MYSYVFLCIIPMYSFVFLCTPMGSIGIPDNLETGSHYWGTVLCIPMESIGIPGNLRAGNYHLGTGSYSYVFLCALHV